MGFLGRGSTRRLCVWCVIPEANPRMPQVYRVSPPVPRRQTKPTLLRAGWGSAHRTRTVWGLCAGDALPRYMADIFKIYQQSTDMTYIRPYMADTG